MKKSLTGMALGLSGSLWLLVMAIISAIISAELSTMFNPSDPLLISTGNPMNLTPLIILTWFMLVGAVIGIIGAVLCLKNSKIGGILLSISAVTALAFTVYYIYLLGSTENTLLVVSYILLNTLPTVLIIASIIPAFSAQKTEIKTEDKKEESESIEEFIEDINNYFKYQTKETNSLVFDKSIEENYDIKTIKKELAKNNYFLTKNKNELIIIKGDRNNE